MTSTTTAAQVQYAKHQLHTSFMLLQVSVAWMACEAEWAAGNLAFEFGSWLPDFQVTISSSHLMLCLLIVLETDDDI